MRLADRVPQCFEAERGEFDRIEVEAFFHARQDVLLDPKSVPLTPLSKLSATVQRRWREYLAIKEAAISPMNGVRPALEGGGGGLARQIREEQAISTPLTSLREAMEDLEAVGVDTVGLAEPWVALGISRRTWFRREADRKKAGTL